MKKIIDNVVTFPNDAQSVKFTCCFTSMIMRTDKMISDVPVLCQYGGKDCNSCGICGDFSKNSNLQKKHFYLYCMYNFVSGYSLLQVDLTKYKDWKDWNVAINDSIEEYDDYITSVANYTGYNVNQYDKSNSKEEILNKIKESIDIDRPVLIQYKKDKQWVVVTGYEDALLFGYDGSHSYWGVATNQPDGYNGDMFYVSDWYDKMIKIVILGVKVKNGVNIFQRAYDIAINMKNNGCFKNTLDYLNDESNFINLDNRQLMKIRDNIAYYIGYYIEVRWSLGMFGTMLINGVYDDINDFGINNENNHNVRMIGGMGFETHDALWVALHAIGEYMSDDKTEYADGLKNKIIRRVIYDVFNIVKQHDEMALDSLKELI